MILIEAVITNTTYVEIKFYQIPKVSSLINDNFVLTCETATPSTIVDPFQAIDVSNDYNSISRILKLYWNEDILEADSDYVLTVTGIKNTFNEIFDDEVIEFSTGDDVNPDDDLLPSEDPVYTIEDHSIVSSAFDTLLISPANIPFSITTIDPFDGDYYLPADYNLGRIVITFSEQYDVDTITSTTVVVQKKAIQRTPSRWETLECELTTGNSSILYIDLPSVDHYPEAATPWTTAIYHTDGEEYFEENYKYRVILSKDIASDADATVTLQVDFTAVFAGVIDPLYVNPDELSSIFPDAEEIEIAEALWLYSSEVKEILSLSDTEDPSFVSLEYIKAAAACTLSKIYDASSGFETSFRLGDLSVTRQPYSKNRVNRTNAATWCELAGVIRKEMLAQKTRMRAVVAGSDHPNPIPSRKFKNYNTETRGLYTVDNPMKQGNLDSFGPS